MNEKGGGEVERARNREEWERNNHGRREREEENMEDYRNGEG